MKRARPLKILSHCAAMASKRLREKDADLMTIAQQMKQSAELVLAELQADRSREAILEVVANYYLADVADLFRYTATARIVFARHVCMWMLRHAGGMTYEEVGKAMGRDHSSAHHAISKIEKLMERDEELRDQIRDIREELSIPRKVSQI